MIVRFQIMSLVLGLYCQGAECMKRILKEADKLGMIFEEPNSEVGERRSVRSLIPIGLERNFGQRDIQRVAEYFMKGGPLTGSPLKQPCDSNKNQNSEKQFRTPLLHLPRIEIPKLPLFQSKEPIVGAELENPWCPASVLGFSQSEPVQPYYTYSGSNGILSSPQSSHQLTPQDFVQIFQPFFDIAQAIERIQVPVARTQNVCGDSLYRSDSSDPGNHIVGASQVQIETPVSCGAEKTLNIVGSLKKATSQIVGASKNCGKKTQNILGAAKATKAAELVGAPKENCGCGGSGPNAGTASLPVQPAFTYPEAAISYSAPKTLQPPQRSFYTINELIRIALAMIQQSPSSFLPTLSGLNVQTFEAPRLSLGNNCPDLKENCNDELTFGAPRRTEQNIIGKCRSGSRLTRAQNLEKISKPSLKKELGVRMGKLPREAKGGLDKFPEPEEVVAPEVLEKTTIEPMEVPAEKEMAKTLEKRDILPGVKSNQPAKKLEESVIQKKLEKSVEKVPVTKFQRMQLRK